MRRLFGIGLASAGVLAVALIIGWWQVDGPAASNNLGKRQIPVAEMDFALIDHEGRSVGPKTLLGNASMVFFGFTYCPDVCPTTLSDISGWLERLGEDADRLNVVFITVDPDRDTVEALADYVSYFHPSIRGWTGAPDQIARAAEAFKATYEKVPTEASNYTMNHTASVFLFSAEGRFVSTIDYHEPREFAAPKIRRAMNEDRL